MSDVLAAVHDRLRERAAAATAADAVVGDRAVLATVEHPGHGRLAGLAHRPPGEAAVGERAPAGQARLAVDAGSPARRAVGVATLNALSTPALDTRPGDPMAALDDADVVATVGLFRPALSKFGGATVRVVERDPPQSVAAPDGVAVETYAPGEAAAAFAGADVCFVTGSTLLYGGLDGYLAALRSAGVAPVVLVGATASHLPGPAFSAGVDVVAGARVTDPDRVARRVRAGDCGTDLHDAGVEKVFVTRAGDLPGLAPPGTATNRPREPEETDEPRADPHEP